VRGCEAAGFDGDGSFLHFYQGPKNERPNQWNDRAYSSEKAALRVQST